MEGEGMEERMEGVKRNDEGEVKCIELGSEEQYGTSKTEEDKVKDKLKERERRREEGKEGEREGG